MSLTSLSSHLQLFTTANAAQTLTGIRHGVEREALRIQPDGKLSQQSHPQALGSALCNEYITTDYAETLLEFITQPHHKPTEVLAELSGIQHYVMKNLNGEMMWPLSMPCYVRGEEDVELAQYGSSNIGQMKTLYRKGLRNRYGSMMQLIAGLHYNFSLPDSFWQHWHEQSKTDLNLQDFRSEKYMGLIRNFKRLVWVLPYLFGASPSLCGSFIQGQETSLSFEKLGKGTIYLPYATSLRMSDLGYTSSEQSALDICYNSLPQYVTSLRKAIATPSQQFSELGTKVNGEYQQLNTNILQIENEFYSPIRPKQVANSGEKPTSALASRGISYVEVRALDLDPFEINGIAENSFYFLDTFLLYCLFTDSPELTEAEQNQADENLNAVVLRGRDPELRLEQQNQSLSVQTWLTKMFADLKETAVVLDQAYGSNDFSLAIDKEYLKVEDPNQTPSAKLLNKLKAENLDNGEFALSLAKSYQQELVEQPIDKELEAFHKKHATESVTKQLQQEQSDLVDFDSFLSNYFAQE